jgi:hypothetical protein
MFLRKDISAAKLVALTWAPDFLPSSSIRDRSDWVTWSERNSGWSGFDYEYDCAWDMQQNSAKPRTGYQSNMDRALDDKRPKASFSARSPRSLPMQTCY